MNETVDDLVLVTFVSLNEPIVFSSLISLNSFKVVSNYQKISILSNDNCISIPNFIIINTTVKISTNDSLNILKVNELYRENAHFTSSDNKQLCLIINDLNSFDKLKDFDKILIESPDFKLPDITSNQHENISLEVITNLMTLSLDIVIDSECDLTLNDNLIRFFTHQKFVEIKTYSNINFQIIHNSTSSLSLQSLMTSNNIIDRIVIYNGNLIVNDLNYCEELIKVDFYNITECVIYSTSNIPFTISSFGNLTLNIKQNTSIIGYLMLDNGNITLNNNDDNSILFSCLSILNYQDFEAFNIKNISQMEFYETKHNDLNGYLILSSNTIFAPKFLLSNYINNINGGITRVDYIENYDNFLTNIEIPKTQLILENNGTIVIDFHLNFNETYDEAEEIYNKRMDRLRRDGLVKPFDFDNFYDSFKYYYMKFIPVFSNFSRTFSKAYNQFYHPLIQVGDSFIEDNDKYNIFIQRKDTPLNSFYRTENIPLICNISCDIFDRFNFEISESMYQNALEFNLNGDFQCNNSCIEFKLYEIPTSASEFFVYVVNNEIIETLKNIPFITILTPTNIASFSTLFRNSKSKNIAIVICESVNQKLDLTFIRTDSNIFIIGLSIQNTNDFVDFFNTIRKGNDLKKDFKLAINKISKKIPSILPSLTVNISTVQSLFAFGVKFTKSKLNCGSILLSSCSFSKNLYIASSELVTDLYSYQNMMNINRNEQSYSIHSRFINITLIPNYISNETSDLLAINKIEFDDNCWYFYSKGTLFGEVSYNFGIPYSIVEDKLSIYSITDKIEYSFIQNTLPIQPLRLFTGQIGDELQNSIGQSILLSESNNNIIDIPEQIDVVFSGKWETKYKLKDHFYIDFGKSNAVIQQIPPIDISFSSQRNLSIDCSGKIQNLSTIIVTGNGLIQTNNGSVAIQNLKIDSQNKLINSSIKIVDKNDNTNTTSQVRVENLEVLNHTTILFNDILIKDSLILNPSSLVEIQKLTIEEQKNVKFIFNYNYDYKIPTLVIHEYNTLPNHIFLKFKRDIHSKYQPSFYNMLGISQTFLKIDNTKCSNIYNKNTDFIQLESDFIAFDKNSSYINISCQDTQDYVSFLITLIDIPSLQLNSQNQSNTKIPITPPYLYEPTKTPIPESSNLTAIIVGSTVAGVAVIGIASFVIYFCIVNRRETNEILDPLNSEKEVNVL